jgi:hypothetical protein
MPVVSTPPVGLVMLKVSVVVPPNAMLVGLNALVSVGTGMADTVKSAVLTTAVPALVCKVLVVLVTVPTVLLVMG